jgi:hypothetical protein
MKIAGLLGEISPHRNEFGYDWVFFFDKLDRTIEIFFVFRATKFVRD